MNHSEVKKQLAGYLEGELDLALRASVDAHLDDCADCAQEVAEMQQTIRLLRMLPEPEQPPMVAANVMRRIRAGETEPGLLERIGRTLGGIFEPSFVLPASAVAAAAFVVVVVQEPGGLSGMLSDGFGLGTGAPVLNAQPEVRVEALGTSPLTAAVPTPLTPFLAPTLTPTLTPPFSPSSSTRPTASATRATGMTASASRAQMAAQNRAATSAGTPGVDVNPRSYGAPAAQDFLMADSAPSGITSGKPRVYSDVGVDPGLYTARAQPRSGTRSPAGRALPVARPTVNGFSGSGLRPQGFAPTPRSASATQSLRGHEPTREGLSSGGEDVRDLWIARGLEDPVGFANFIADRNLAEQELFVARLSERAHERGLLAALLTALRASGDETAAWVADDFAAERPN